MVARCYTYTLTAVILGLIQCPGTAGLESSLCYIHKSDTENSLCPSSKGKCCSSSMVDFHSITFYHNSGCDSTTKCGSGKGCCSKRTKEADNVTSEYNKTITQTFYNTSCFKRVSTINGLPFNNGIYFIVVNYTCNTDEAVTSSGAPTSNRREGTEGTTGTTGTTASTTTLVTDAPGDGSEGDATIIIAVATTASVFVVAVIIIVVVIVICMRRKAAMKSKASQDNRRTTGLNANTGIEEQCSNQHSSNEDRASGSSYVYAVVNKDRKRYITHAQQDMEEYNVINLRSLPVMKDETYGYKTDINKTGDDEYDHARILSTIGPESDMYARANHSSQDRSSKLLAESDNYGYSSVAPNNTQSFGHWSSDNQYDSLT